MRTYKVTSDYEGNDEFEVDARSLADAYHQALNVLGWNVGIKSDIRNRIAEDFTPDQD